MLYVILFHPEIPPNTGNIARLCAATGTGLHLIGPLGFSLEDRYLKRAGLDYWPHVQMRVWPSLEAYLSGEGLGRRLVGTSARKGTPLHHAAFTGRDSLLFGPESTGLPEDVRMLAQSQVRIPVKHCVRSLNLSTAAGIILYAALAGLGCLDALDGQA
jgi:tRNA (cytidine/uridine-2'-O-)-methyltransferase